MAPVEHLCSPKASHALPNPFTFVSRTFNAITTQQFRDASNYFGGCGCFVLILYALITLTMHSKNEGIKAFANNDVISFSSAQQWALITASILLTIAVVLRWLAYYRSTLLYEWGNSFVPWKLYAYRMAAAAVVAIFCVISIASVVLARYIRDWVFENYEYDLRDFEKAVLIAFRTCVVIYAMAGVAIIFNAIRMAAFFVRRASNS